MDDTSRALDGDLSRLYRRARPLDPAPWRAAPVFAGAARGVLLGSRKMASGRQLFPTATAAALTFLVWAVAAVPAAAHAPIEEQIEALSRRIAAHPRDALPYLRPGELHRLLLDASAARADYEKARRIDPTLAIVDLGL